MNIFQSDQDSPLSVVTEKGATSPICPSTNCLICVLTSEMSIVPFLRKLHRIELQKNVLDLRLGRWAELDHQTVIPCQSRLELQAPRFRHFGEYQ